MEQPFHLLVTIVNLLYWMADAFMDFVFE